MKLVVLLLLTLAVFSEDEHTHQGTIEKKYCFTLPSDYEKNPYDLIRDFQVHCDTDSGTSLTLFEGSCIHILNDGIPVGFSSENQCIFTLKVDAACVDESLDKLQESEDTGTAKGYGMFKTGGHEANIQINVCFNNIRKPAAEELSDQP
jgi:hypothetical protein